MVNAYTGTMVRRVIPHQPWKAFAVCYGTDPAVFYFDDVPARHLQHAVEAARAICESCPVRQPCLEYAVYHENLGFWGGRTEKERQAIRRRRGRVARRAAQA